MIGLFFTGTDTGVGKTHVTAAVARSLREHGHAVVVCKPVATGAENVGGRWVSDDTRRLAAASGENDFDRVTRWTFPEPVAPPVAARQHGVVLTLEGLVAFVREQQRPGAPVLVEGVGGLLCPLTEQATVADLAAELGLPVVMVARRCLGTLNHTLLTVEVARGRGLPLAGVIVNATLPSDELADRTNVEELRRWNVPVLAVVPYQHGTAEADVNALAAVDWWRLCHGEF
jgi:dethiobiotin synthetase